MDKIIKSKTLAWILVLLFSFILFMCSVSCSTRKKSVYKERIVTVYDTLYKRDSIFLERVKVVNLPSVTTSVISNPCAESGKLNPVNENIKFPYGNVNISPDEKGNLKVQVNTDSISSEYEKQYKERNEKQLHQISELEKENATLKITPFNWWIVGCIASLAVNILLLFLYVKNKLIG